MILMNDFKAEPVEVREAMLEAAKRVIESGWYILGPEVTTFEAEWAKRCSVDFGVGVGNGVDAIEIGLRCLDIEPGDEVITTPMTAFATVLAVIRAGATPVLADIDPETGLLSIDSVSRCLSEKTKAVVLVHLYGQIRDMQKWVDFCHKKSIALIEDCAQSHLASMNGCVAGSFGALGAYSFYPTKNLGAPGDAGMLVTNTEAIAKRAERLRNYGQSVRYQHPELGMNSRLDELQAAILLARLKWLETNTLRRQEIADLYRAGLNNNAVQLLAAPQFKTAHVYHLFVVLCERRDELQAHLQSHGVQALIHYPIPIHNQVPCKEIKQDPQGLSHSELHANTCLSLPCHPQMSDRDVQIVIAAVNNFTIK